MEKILWVLELQDKFSRPAKAMSSAIDSLMAKFGKLKAPNVDGDSILKSIVGGNLISSAITKVGELGLSFARAGLSALSFKEDTLSAFKVLTGSASDASKLYKEVQQIGAETPFTNADVANTFKRLLGSGFKQDDLHVLFQGLGDVASMQGEGGAVALDGMTRAITQMKSKGVVSMEELQGQFLDHANGIVGMTDILQVIGKQAGAKGSADEIANIARGMISRKEVTADAGVFAIMKAIEGKFGALGSGMKTQSQTLTGLTSTLLDAPKLLLDSMDSGKIMDPLKTMIRGVTAMLSPDSPVGQAIIGLLGHIGDVFGRVVGMFSGGKNSTEKWTNALTFFVFMLDAAVTILEKIVTGWDALVNGIDWAYIPEQIKAAFSGLWDWLKDMFSSVGQFLMKGLAHGIAGSTGIPVNTIFKAGEAIIGGAMDVFGIRSPSKVFQELGEYTGEGFNIGLNDSLGMPAVKLSSAIAGSKRGTGAAGAGVQVSVNIDARGSDADGIVAKLREVLPGELAGLFEQLAIESGIT